MTSSCKELIGSLPLKFESYWEKQMHFKSAHHGHENIALMVKDSRKIFSPNRGSGRRLNTGKYTNAKSVAGFLFTSSNR